MASGELLTKEQFQKSYLNSVIESGLLHQIGHSIKREGALKSKKWTGTAPIFGVYRKLIFPAILDSPTEEPLREIALVIKISLHAHMIPPYPQEDWFAEKGDYESALMAWEKRVKNWQEGLFFFRANLLLGCMEKGILSATFDPKISYRKAFENLVIAVIDSIESIIGRIVALPDAPFAEAMARGLPRSESRSR